MSAVVDADDYAELAQFSWYAHPGANTFYAVRRPLEGGVKRTYYMHRVILGLGPYRPGGAEGDHVDGNGLNNRRSNLRVVSHQQNALNRDNHKIPDRLCAVCGEAFSPGKSRANRIYCSSRCFGLRPDNPRTARVLSDLVCPTCDEVFRPRNHRTKFCSLSCRRR